MRRNKVYCLLLEKNGISIIRNHINKKFVQSEANFAIISDEISEWNSEVFLNVKIRSLASLIFCTQQKDKRTSFFLHEIFNTNLVPNHSTF